MGYAKERRKFEELLVRITGINMFNEKNLSVLLDSHVKYSHTLRILKNKNPDAFIELYKNELQEIKEAKKTFKESGSGETSQDSFTAYRDSIILALEKTIKKTTEA